MKLSVPLVVLARGRRRARSGLYRPGEKGWTPARGESNHAFLIFN